MIKEKGKNVRKKKLRKYTENEIGGGSFQLEAIKTKSWFLSEGGGPGTIFLPSGGGG